MNLKIFLSSGHFPISNALESLAQIHSPLPIELYCLCENESEAAQMKKRCKAIRCGEGIASFKLFTQHDFNSVGDLANHHLMEDSSYGYVLFLSSDIIPKNGALERMIERMASDDQAAGANPALLAGWLPRPMERIAFMGLTFDFKKKLHYLYEGILAANPLAIKERFFQIGHPGCLLIRCADFRKAGGLRVDLGFLSFPFLCLQILNFRFKGFFCVPEAPWRLYYKFDSWSFCGLWDSILQRGRLKVDSIKSDYAKFCREDGMAYAVDNWLVEGPAQTPDISADLPIRCWQDWSYHPKPTTLLPFLSSLPVAERFHGLELARNRPARLPQTLQYYKVQAERLKALAKDCDLSLAAQIELWQGKIRRFHHGELKPGIELLKKAGIYNCSLDICPAIFDAWVETTETFEKLEISESWPEIAVVMPVWNPNPNFLRQAIESVMAQTYPNWQLCIADDASTKCEIRPLLESFAKRSERIRIKFRDENGHICRATNTALELVDAPFTAFFDHDDLLSPHALGEVAKRIARQPNLGLIYTDDDRINEYNVRRNPLFKPDFDQELFYTGHLSTFDTRLIRELGGLRIGTEGAQDMDLSFRAIELLDHSRIAHIPCVLYHWRVHEESTACSILAKPYIRETGPKVYLEAAARQGRKAEWTDTSPHRLFRLLHYPGKRCLCSVIFLIEYMTPSKRLLDTVKTLEKYVDVEIHAQPLRKSSPSMDISLSFPYVGDDVVHAYNVAATKAAGCVLLFLSASLEPDRYCRLEDMVELAMTPHIAMASGNIWLNGKLASGGWYPDANGLPFQLLQGMVMSEAKEAAWGHIFHPRHVLGAPWECMAVKAEVCQNGQFLDENYGALATVDFALRAMRQNQFVAMDPWVNWQTGKKPIQANESELKYLLDRRGSEIAACGLRNPNLRAAPDKDWTLIL